MLKHVVDRKAVARKIAIATCCDALNELLQNLLRQWKFEIHPAATASVLLLAEEGCAEPCEGQKALWFTHAPGGEEGGLRFPFSVENLWKLLELHFHHPPRLHIRLDLGIKALIAVGGESRVAEIGSLSDMGARFIYHRELVRDQQTFVTLMIDGVSLRIESRVIYAIPRSSTAENEMKVGVLFSGIENDQREMLRSFLLFRTLQEVQAKMAAEQFAKALEFLELPQRVRDKLKG